MRLSALALALALALAAFNAGCGGSSKPHPPSPSSTSTPVGFSIDRPPAGALGPLREFASCMRGHGISMPEPRPWSGHAGRLIVFLPPHTDSTHAAYAACDHFRVLAKVRGGPH